MTLDTHYRNLGLQQRRNLPVESHELERVNPTSILSVGSGAILLYQDGVFYDERPQVGVGILRRLKLRVVLLGFFPQKREENGNCFLCVCIKHRFKVPRLLRESRVGNLNKDTS